MNGSMATLRAMLDAIASVRTENTVIICPAFTMLCANTGLDPAQLGRVTLGAQDISEHESGSYTGDVSAKMVTDTGAKYVIVGHSDRHKNHDETNETVAAKAAVAMAHGLIPIICVGESRAQKESGQTMTAIEKQVRESIPGPGARTSVHVIVAYEPLWAISTTGMGLTPTLDDIRDIHAHIAKILDEMNLGGTAILYGGSVNGRNAGRIMAIPHVDGVLVGGSSLEPNDFIPIITAK